MKRAIITAGVILSIAVLATGSIVPSVEAMKPTVDPATGIKIQCKIMKGDLSCKVSSNDKIDYLEMILPNGEVTFTDSGCAKSHTVSTVAKEGVYIVYGEECKSQSSQFQVFVDKYLKITMVTQNSS